MSRCVIDLLIMKKHRCRNSVRSRLPGSDSSWNTISHIWAPSTPPTSPPSPSRPLPSPPGCLETRPGDPGVRWLRPTNDINERWSDISQAACTALHRAELHWMLNAHFVNSDPAFERVPNRMDARSPTPRGASLSLSIYLSIYLYLYLYPSHTQHQPLVRLQRSIGRSLILGNFRFAVFSLR